MINIRLRPEQNFLASPPHYGEINASMTIKTKNKTPFSTNAGKMATPKGEEVLNKLKNFKGEHAAAVGLSGGVDSSLTAALLVQAGW